MQSWRQNHTADGTPVGTEFQSLIADLKYECRYVFVLKWGTWYLCCLMGWPPKKISVDYLASIVRFEENTRLTKSVYLQLWNCGFVLFLKKKEEVFIYLLKWVKTLFSFSFSLITVFCGIAQKPVKVFPNKLWITKRKVSRTGRNLRSKRTIRKNIGLCKRNWKRKFWKKRSNTNRKLFHV